MKDITVIKRDGKSEKFNPEKVQQVVLASGISPLDSEEIVEQITSWVESLGQNTVSSLKIRDRLFEELEKTDMKASGLFAWHQNRKNQ